MSPDFNIKLHSILGHLNVVNPSTTRREGTAAPSDLTSRTPTNQPSSMNYISSPSFRSNEKPVARENSLVRQHNQKENVDNAACDFSIDNFKVKYNSEIKPTSRPQTNYSALNNVLPRGDPFQNIHIPTFKINFTSNKLKPETVKSNFQKYFVLSSVTPTQKSSTANMEKPVSISNNYCSVENSLPKRPRPDGKTNQESYHSHSMSLSDLHKKLLFKPLEDSIYSKGSATPLAERANKNRENRMETTRENRTPIAYDKLYTQR